MSEPTAAGRLIDAERGVVVARDHLGLTIAELQTRLDPNRVANKAKTRAAVLKQKAFQGGTSAAQASADAIRSNPGALVGAAAAIAVFLARGRIAGLFHRSPSAPPPDSAIVQRPPRSTNASYP